MAINIITHLTYDHLITNWAKPVYGDKTADKQNLIISKYIYILGKSHLDTKYRQRFFPVGLKSTASE